MSRKSIIFLYRRKNKTFVFIVSSFVLQVSVEILPGQAAIMTNIKEKNPSNVSNKTY